ncbi:MAG: HD domain-containing protein [Candidatus Liptonbacteria bacterium]
MEIQVPKEVRAILGLLEKEGHKAYLVGGCVRDILLGRTPKDWDVATDATPEEIQKIFPENVYENNFGTVGVKTDSEDLSLKVVEVTTFRIEGRYTDKRHPDEVRFAKTIEEDLSRRDFTINAIAMSADSGMVDPFGGAADLEKRVLRTVHDPDERFSEDALRLMRAVRFSVELGFKIDQDAFVAIKKLSKLLKDVAVERIRDEFTKIIMTKRATEGVDLLENTGLMAYIIPELCEGIGATQNKHHVYTVYEHSLRSLDYVAKEDASLTVRLATLLHDVGKPRTKGGDGPNATFHGHEVVGARMTRKILERLHYSNDIIELAVHLVRYHMFYYNVGDVSDTGVRRFVRRVGPENIPDLLKVREGDRIGSGVPKAVPYKLRHLLFMIEKVKNDPLSPKMLALNGEDIMKLLDIPPGPRIGQILGILLEDVLDNPARNTKEYLEKRAKEVSSLTDAELAKLAKKARDKKDELEGDIEEEMKKKYYVK